MMPSVMVAQRNATSERSSDLQLPRERLAVAIFFRDTSKNLDQSLSKQAPPVLKVPLLSAPKCFFSTWCLAASIGQREVTARNRIHASHLKSEKIMTSDAARWRRRIFGAAETRLLVLMLSFFLLLPTTIASSRSSSSSSSSSANYSPYHYDMTVPQFTPDGRLLQVE